MPTAHLVVPQHRTANLTMTEAGDDLLVYDQDSHALHVLEPVVASIWQACDSAQTVDSIARLTGHHEDIVRASLTQLDDADLLVSPLPAPIRQTTTRRTLLRKAGIAAVPAIVSVTIPAATAAESSAPPCVIICGGLVQGTCCDPGMVCSDSVRPGVNYGCVPRGGGGIRR